MDLASALGELPEKFRDWYEHNATARRAYARLRADLSTVADRATPKVGEIWERIAPLADPSRGGATESSADAISRSNESASPPEAGTGKADR
jgi:hypothetical protein